jgi:hypothetical protein
MVTLGDNYPLELFLTGNNGKPTLGATITYVVKQSSTNNTVASGSLTELGSGMYQDFYLTDTLGYFHVIYSTPAGHTDEVEYFKVDVECAKQTDLIRLLGLNHENTKIFNPSYTTINTTQGPRKVLVQSTIRIYPSKTDTDNDTNHIAEYTMTATHDSEACMIDYKMVLNP